MKSVYEYYVGEDRYPDLDAAGAVSRLSEAVRCRTINELDHSKTDFSSFDRLQELMRRSYPAVMEAGRFSNSVAKSFFC